MQYCAAAAPSTTYGPLSSEAAARRLIDQIDVAVRLGATVHTGGRRVNRPGSYLEATVLTGVTPTMRAFHEELFGPVAVIYRVADAEDAVALANSTQFGHGCAIYTRDRTLAVRIADRLDAGMVFINSPERGAPHLPFGGTKRSGVANSGQPGS